MNEVVTSTRAFIIGLLCGVLVACGTLVPRPITDAGVIFAGGIAGGGTAVSFDAGSSDAGLPWRTACSVLNARRCDALKRCGLLPDDTESYRACLSWLSATWCGPAKWVPRVDVGTLRYDSVRAETCATDWTTRACSDVLTEPSSCSRFLSPAVPLRGACYDGYAECVDGVCRGGACPRTCQQRGGVGDVCQVNTDCQSTLYCRTGVATGTSQCAAYGAEGSTCSPTQWCGQGMHCVGTQCRTLPAADHPCVSGRCDDNSFCVAVDGGTCEARRDAGVSCSDDAQCSNGLVCDTAANACVTLDLGSIGASCTRKQRCPTGATCLIEPGLLVGVCGAPKRADEPCQAATDCQAHLTCTATDGGSVCGPRLDNQASCTVARDCHVLSACVSGRCVDQPTLGKDCSTTSNCLFGACVDIGDAGSRCIEPQGPGQPCRTGQDCASSRCEQGLCTAACLP